MSENQDLSFLDELGLGFEIDRLGPATRPTPMRVSCLTPDGARVLYHTDPAIGFDLNAPTGNRLLDSGQGHAAMPGVGAQAHAHENLQRVDGSPGDHRPPDHLFFESDARQASRCARPPRFRWPGRTRQMCQMRQLARVSSSRSARSICRWYSRSATLRTVSAMPKRGSTFC